MARRGERSSSALLLFWSAVSCLVVHNLAEPGSDVMLRESLQDQGKVDMWEAEGEPIISVVSEDYEEAMCLDSKGLVKVCEPGIETQLWVYKRLHGGTLATATGNKCLTRKGDAITVEECNGSATQKWQRLCGAWANGDGTSGRVLEFTGKEGDLEVRPRAAQWTGEKKQLWLFQEKVHHSQCDKKAHKVMKFDGTTGSTVVLRSFLSMPSKIITVGLWMKGSKGTPFSYGSKNHHDAFVLRNIQSLEVIVKDHKVPTGLDFTSKKWVHLAVSWNSESGDLKVFKNGKQVFSKTDVQKGKAITQGGCAWFGQRQKTYCTEHDASASFKGLLTDVQIWREGLDGDKVEKMMTHPVDDAILEKLGKMTTLKTPQNQRAAFLTRQYNAEEMTKPTPEVCRMDAFKKKETPKLPKVGGNMHRFTGSGDVHYRNFANCHFDDQSVGEWVLATTLPEFYRASPLSIQFRTNPSKTNCPWCQDGAVSYIDGCAVKFRDEQASGGFGGFHFPGVPGKDGRGSGQYRPYTAFNGRPLNGHRRGKNMEAWGNTGYLRVSVFSEGIVLNCRRYSISLTMPNTYRGKVGGIAGSGLGANHDWRMGPNTNFPWVKPYEMLPTARGHCPRRYVYGIRSHIFNGNHITKPIVQFFRSWQVDGEHIPSAFYYSGSTGPGSFNRNAGQPIRNVNDRPSGKKQRAIAECKLLRETPEAREKCVFDFMVLGEKAVKDSQRDRMAQRAANIKTPTVRDVRDVTSFKMDAKWAGKPGWECGDEFIEMQKALAAKHEDLWASRKAERRQKDAEEFARCPAGFSVVAEQTEVHTQETRKCSAGMVALGAQDVEKAKEAEKKAEDKKEQGDDDRKRVEQKLPFWGEVGPQPVTTQVHSPHCFGTACLKAPLKPQPGPCKDPDFPHLSKLNPKICYTEAKYINGGPNPGCSSWCCLDASCQAGCAVNQCKSPGQVARETVFLSSSGSAIFSSGKNVNKQLSHVFVPEDEVVAEAAMATSASRSLLSSTVEAVEEDAGEDIECKDSNEDKNLSCEDLKASCDTDLVQSMCAATCGTPWAGNSACQRRAAAEKKYQCKPASVCKMTSLEPELPEGYQWVSKPATHHAPSNITKPWCQAQASVGVAMCATGKKAKAQYTKNKEVIEFPVQCGCEGGFKLIAKRSTSMNAACTPTGQDVRHNQTQSVLKGFQDYEAQAAAWAEACSTLEKSTKAFDSASFPLEPLKSGVEKTNFFAQPWRFRPLHTKNLVMESEDKKCTAVFRRMMWGCDAGPMRDVVFYLPGRGYEKFQLGCGCQQLRAQASYSGQITKMQDQTAETQAQCARQFMEWNTQFQEEVTSEYFERTQQLSDELERQCMRSTLELNSVVVQEQHNAYDTKLILEENAAHLGRLSSIRYKMQLKEANDKKDLEKCQRQQFVVGGLPQFDYVTKELAHTKDPKRAKELHSQLLKLKQELDAKQLQPNEEL